MTGQQSLDDALQVALRTQQRSSDGVRSLEHGRAGEQRAAAHAVLPEVGQRGRADEAADEARLAGRPGAEASLRSC